MQMRTGRAARRADFPDKLSGLHVIADLDVDFRQMAVARGEAVAISTMRPYPPDQPDDTTLPLAVARTGSPAWARKSRPVCIAGRPRNGSARTPNPEENSASPITGLR